MIQQDMVPNAEKFEDKDESIVHSFYQWGRDFLFFVFY
jgi:hypothetical protein